MSVGRRIRLFKRVSIFTMLLVVLIFPFFIFEIPKTMGNYKIYPTRLTMSHLAKDVERNLPISPVPMAMNMQTTKSTQTSITPGLCEIVDQVNQATLARRFPHIIIIGFGKAGTRAVYQMIRMHPDLKGPMSEMRFFSNDAKYKQGIKFYIRQMPVTNLSQKTIEKSPDYIIKEEAAVRLQKALIKCHRVSNIKFIVVFRDPFDRAVSEYLLWKKEIVKSMNKRLAPFEDISVKKNGDVNKLNKQVNASIYSYHLGKWLKYYKMKQFCFVDGSILVKNPYLEIKKLEKCLELRSFIQPSHFAFNKSRGFFCPVLADGIPKCLSKTKGVTHPKIKEDVERKLRQFFIPFNRKLYNMTGVNYGWT